MSLINDALKKARLEAARQEAARRGVPLPPLAAARPRRSPRVPLVAAGAVAVALLIGAALFTAGRRSAEPGPAAGGRATGGETVPAAAPPAAAESAAPSKIAMEPIRPPAVGEPPPRPTPAPAAAPAAATPPAPRSAASEPRAVAPERPADTPRAASPETRSRERAPTRTLPELPPAQIRIAREPVSAAPARPQAGAEPPTSEVKPTYVREALLPGGAGKLELGGIAWSEDRPFALINGRVVGPGDQIEAFMVVQVQPKRVELRGEGGSFYLQLK